MKCIAVCFLFAVTLTCCLAAKRCDNTEECDAGQCCLARGILGWSQGDCKDFAELDKSCNSGDLKVFRKDQYILHCPCVPGLNCEPTEIKDIPIFGTVKINERCVAGATTIKPEEPTFFTTSEPDA